MKIKTYKEMNEKIVGILKLGNQSEQYAAARITELEIENTRLTEQLKNAVVLPLLVTFKNGDCEIAYIMRSDDNFITVMHFTGINAKSEAEARLAEIKAKENE